MTGLHASELAGGSVELVDLGDNLLDGQTVAESGRESRSPRHPCQLTSARLVDHLDRYDRHITPAERSAVELAIAALDQLPFREDAARRAGVDRG